MTWRFLLRSPPHQRRRSAGAESDAKTDARLVWPVVRRVRRVRLARLAGLVGELRVARRTGRSCRIWSQWLGLASNCATGNSHSVANAETVSGEPRWNIFLRLKDRLDLPTPSPCFSVFSLSFFFMLPLLNTDFTDWWDLLLHGSSGSFQTRSIIILIKEIIF